MKMVTAKVVPLAGTWIETRKSFVFTAITGSFPLRERGLKQCGFLGREGHLPSFPLRERGLKQPGYVVFD